MEHPTAVTAEEGCSRFSTPIVGDSIPLDLVEDLSRTMCSSVCNDIHVLNKPMHRCLLITGQSLW